MEFWKYHALGNDYLVLDPKVQPEPPDPEQIALICHRNFGLGSDGILYGPGASDQADFGLRIFNPDGGEAEKSGNGLRIFARYLFDQGHVSEEAPFSVETLGGIVTPRIFPGARRVEVGMGTVSFRSDRIPVTGPVREVLDEAIEVGGTHFRYYAATVGNPHCVIPVPEATRELAIRYGPLLERHSHFPHRTNVQFLQVIDRSRIRIEIWERGAGYTLASGTSSSAAASVARRMGSVDADITVEMPGGEIEIRIADDWSISMTGGVTRVGRFEMEAEALAETLPA